MSKSEDQEITTFRIDKRLHREALDIMKEMGLRSVRATFRAALLVMRREGLIPYAVPSLVFKDSRPVVLTGEPGSGKTTLIKQLLMTQRKTPALIIDVNDEFRDSILPNGKKFKGFEKLEYGDIFKVDFTKPGRYRIVPNPNIEMSKVQVKMLLSHFNMNKLTGFDPDILPSGLLSDWIIVIDEGHRFLAIDEFTPFIVEARKVTNKVLIVCTDWKALEGKGLIMKPPPWGDISQE